MNRVTELKILLAYHEQCTGFTLPEAIEYLTEWATEEGLFPRLVRDPENEIKKTLYREKHGPIPTRMCLLMAGGFPNFDSMTPSEKTEMDVFNRQWDEMFNFH